MRAKLVLALVLLTILAAAAAAPSPYPLGTRLFLTAWMIFFSWPALRVSGRKEGWFLYVLLTPLWLYFGRFVFPGLGYGLAIAWVALFPILRLLFLRQGWTRRYDWTPRVDGPGGGRTAGYDHAVGGGNPGAGGGAGGGFSGGGGRFGGGGASGSW
ncbi:MAG TPA: hypothetical protein VFR03_01265 [Thermoanaerobaculia bacterium]|nr:hypothetical protein [Thermoanaerobaculia bacterium]